MGLNFLGSFDNNFLALAFLMELSQPDVMHAAGMAFKK